MALKKCWAVFHFDPKTVQSSSLFYSIIGKENGVKTFFLDESEAMIAANEVAARNPGDPVVVLESKYIVEAKVPDTIAKSWKENGELIPVEKSLIKSKKKIDIDPIEQQLRIMTERPRREPRANRPTEIRYEFNDVPNQRGEILGQVPDPNQRPIPVVDQTPEEGFHARR